MLEGQFRFTHHSRQALRLSEDAAGEFLHDQIGPEHILIGLMREKDGAAFSLIQQLGVDPEQICKSVEKSVKVGSRPPSGLTLNRDAKHILALAVDEARRMGNFYVATHHLLLGILSQRRSIAIHVLKQFRVDYRTARNIARRLLEEAAIPEIADEAFKEQVMRLSPDSREQQISVIENTVKICGNVLSTISQEQALAKRAANGQTVLQLLGHMADYDEYIHQCALQMLEEDYPQLPAYDFDEVNTAHNEQAKDVLYAQLFQSRTQLVEFFLNLTDEQWTRVGVHPEYEQVSLLDLFLQFTATDTAKLEELTRVITAR